MFFKKKNVPAWGLDIGDKSLKLISLLPQGQSHNVVNFNSVSLPEGVFDNGRIIDEAVITEHIHKLINESVGPKLKSPFVHSCLPETQTYIKLIAIPEMTDKEIPEAVRWASEHHIPLPTDEMYLDWQIVNHDVQKKQINILIGAVQKEISDNYSKLLKNSGLIPLSLEIEATAIGRALIDNKASNNTDKATAIIDIGATRTSLIIYAHPSIQFTSSLPFAGEDVTKTISHELSLSRNQSEQAKIICGLDTEKCQGALKTVLDGKLHELVDKVKTAMSYYQKNFENSLPIKNITLCGGGAHFKGIDKFLSNQLSIPSKIGDPRLHCVINNSKFPKDKILSFTTAIGLALKAYE